MPCDCKNCGNTTCVFRGCDNASPCPVWIEPTTTKNLEKEEEAHRHPLHRARAPRHALILAATIGGAQ